MSNLEEQKRMFACKLRAVAMDAWEESKHKRAKDGRFGTMAGEHGKKGKEVPNNHAKVDKQSQLDIILKSNPMKDDYHTGIRNLDDIKTAQEAFEEDGVLENGFTPDANAELFKNALKTGVMKVYSSYPIENGVFVSPSRMEAESYSGSGKIYEKELPLNSIAWIDAGQGQVAIVGNNDSQSQKPEQIQPPNKEGYGEDWKKLFHQTKARKQYDALKKQFDEAKENKDIDGMSAAMEQIDKLLTDPSNEGTKWKDEEWTPRDKSGDKIADDGTIMKNGVALDKTFQDGGTSSKYRLARNKWVKQLLSSEDGTFDLETGKPVEYDKGFQVAFQTTASEKDGGMSDEEYDRIVDDVVKQTGAKPELGCFEVPEISFHFEDRLQALQMMEKFNQHSIWNWGKFRIVMNKKLDTSTNDVKQGDIAKGGEQNNEEK